MIIEKKRVVITGASTGLGKELAFAFADRGCSVVLAARNTERLMQNAEEVERRGGRALAVSMDVSSRSQTEALVARVMQVFGGIDIFINNAGIAPAYGTVLENTEDDFRRTWEVNLMAAFYAVRAVAPVMEKAGGGMMVFVSSIVGKRAVPLSSAYCSSKFALQGFTESIRPELARKKIHVLSVCPAGIDTPFFEQNGKAKVRRFRVHPPERIARAILRACEKDKREILPTIDAKLLYWLNIAAPRFLDWAIAKNKGV